MIQDRIISMHDPYSMMLLWSFSPLSPWAFKILELCAGHPNLKGTHRMPKRLPFKAVKHFHIPTAIPSKPEVGEPCTLCPVVQLSLISQWSHDNHVLRESSKLLTWNCLWLDSHFFMLRTFWFSDHWLCHGSWGSILVKMIHTKPKKVIWAPMYYLKNYGGNEGVNR